MREQLRQKLAIAPSRLEALNDYLLDPHNPIINDLLDQVQRYGGPEAINAKAQQARSFDHLIGQLREQNSPYLTDLQWLEQQREAGRFVSLTDYRRKILGATAATTTIDEAHAVTLEISALQYFPFLIEQARRAIENQELMPGRYIRVRNMKEQVADGDILAVAAAMQIIGASHVETLDTRGTDGSNVHLGGPATITGYFGGIGQPNEHALLWLDEYLHYYTTYGVRQVLNVNAGTILLALLLHKLGVDIEFKISVYMGIDNPYSTWSTLMLARLLSRDDDSTALVGFNLSNSVSNDTIERAGGVRRALGLEQAVRFEHHITETYQAIVVQPYNRRDELVRIAPQVANISAKHEGGDPEVDATRSHPSSILDYFLTKEAIAEQNLGADLLLNYLDKHDAVNRTAEALTRAGIGLVAAQRLHRP